MRLTLKHLEFCRLIVSGETLADAYRKVSPKVKDSSARSAGAHLAKKPEIVEEINRLRGDIESKTISSDLERRMILADMIRGKLPTKRVIDGDGKVTEYFEMREAILLDAKLSGEIKDNDDKGKRSPKFGLSLTANNMQINNGVTTTKSTLPSPAKEAIGSDTPPIIDITPPTSTDIS